MDNSNTNLTENSVVYVSKDQLIVKGYSLYFCDTYFLHVRAAADMTRVPVNKQFQYAMSVACGLQLYDRDFVLEGNCCLHQGLFRLC